MPRLPDPETLEEVRQRAAISVPCAGRLLGLGRNAAWQAVHTGELPSLTFGRRTVVPVPALLEAIGDTSVESRSRDR